MRVITGIIIEFPDSYTVICFEHESDRDLTFNSFQAVNKNNGCQIVKIKSFVCNHEETLHQIHEGFKNL